MEIKNISQRIFRSTAKTAENKSESCANHTNPFGVNFKGNLIKADVFVKPAENKGKMWASAIVGSMNSINESISRRLDSVVDFGNRIKANACDLWNQTRNNFEIPMLPNMKNIINNAKEKISDMSTYSVKNLMKRDRSELDAMLQDEITIKLLGA